MKLGKEKTVDKNKMEKYINRQGLIKLKNYPIKKSIGMPER